MAKNLGFKFVWHNNGKFLVRWKNGERAFTFNTVTDLNVIRNIYDETKYRAAIIGQHIPSQTNYSNKTIIVHDNNNSNPKIQQQQI